MQGSNIPILRIRIVIRNYSRVQSTVQYDIYIHTYIYIHREISTWQTSRRNSLKKFIDHNWRRECDKNFQSSVYLWTVRHTFLLSTYQSNRVRCLPQDTILEYGGDLFYLSKLRHGSRTAMNNKSTVYPYRFGCQVRKCKKPP